MFCFKSQNIISHHYRTVSAEASLHVKQTHIKIPKAHKDTVWKMLITHANTCDTVCPLYH